MTWLNPGAECFPQLVGGGKLITLGCLRIELGWKLQVEYVMDNGERMYLELPQSRDCWPHPYGTYEWDGIQIMPSEATWDDLVDQMPPVVRPRYRGRLCLECVEKVDLCGCGCCPEATKMRQAED